MTPDTLASSGTTARVVAVRDEVITIESIAFEGAVQALMKNEVVYICPRATGERLKSEVLRVRGDTADVQVYEDTRGVAIGDPVEQSGEMLSVELGPGLLRQVYDGLQNPLHRLELDHGRFLPRGVDVEALDRKVKWAFTAQVRVGDKLRAGDCIGTVQEGRFIHKIMLPFAEVDALEVSWIQEGSFTVDTVIARLVDARGESRDMTMVQRWPVKVALPHHVLKQRYSQRLYPSEPITTTMRLIDTFFPIAKGGTGCIPGPFGAGKTVLQNLISRYSDVDIVIVVACGERAGEVVETISEFPQLQDPHSGGTLMDRTIIICNTSSMPVASREASIYTGVTLGEYYRQMGLDVLLLADSTSRWAQAMREISGRLEEIPGEEAFPAYLESSIRNLYERAGVVVTNDDVVGTLTMIGTVSPAGGNFEEPVTQGTLNTVKAFLGLSYDRAYKRFYPAVDPLISWSRYLDQLAPWFRQRLGEEWAASVQRVNELLHRGDGVFKMMQVTGEEGISLEDFILWQKSVFVDMVYLQQDAFDSVDASTSMDRQQLAFGVILGIVESDYKFDSKEQARGFFNRLTGIFRDWNYTAEGTDLYRHQLERVEKLRVEHILSTREQLLGAE